MTIQLVRKTSLGHILIGSIQQKAKGYYWNGFAEGKGKAARTPAATVQQALAHARKALGNVQAYDTETKEYL